MARLIIDLLRHGHCDDGSIYRGRTDSALSAMGMQQMESVFSSMTCGMTVESPVWQHIYSSSLQRCAKPAEAFANRLRLPLTLESSLQELDFGEWDGLSVDEVWKRQAQQVQAFWQDPDSHHPPGGESVQSLQNRLLKLIKQWLESLGPESERRVLCITHGGVIRAILCKLLELPNSHAQQLSLDYASLSRIELYPDSDGTSEHGFYSQLIFFNRRPLLSDYA